MKKSVVLIIGACFMLACSDGKDDPVDPGDLKDKIELCSDNIDNDENGLTDCEDTVKCGDVPICKDGKRVEAENTKEMCEDGHDNDLDGMTDCDDPDCAEFDYCQDREDENTLEKCQDGIDNDKDGKTDCDDPDCAEFDHCQTTPIEEENTLEKCQDGIDNDKDGKTDCGDPDCAEFDHCKTTEEENTKAKCQDGIDNDKDGKTDCDDPDCAEFDHCQITPVEEENTLEKCQDLIDNDNDGLTDCEDPDCAEFDHCSAKIDKKGESSLADCKDGKDNDNDGFTDCEDIGCATYEFCAGREIDEETTEEQCKDGIDNDGDGFTDCEEGACQGYDFCEDECLSDPFKFVKDDCPCNETQMPDGTCAINITNGQEFVAYAQDYSRDAILKLDIDLGKIPDYTTIGTEESPFAGKFYGGDKRISGEVRCVADTVYCGLFGVADGATFVDIDVAVTLSSNNSNVYSYVGGLLAYGTDVTISKIKLPAKVLAKTSGVGTRYKCKAGAVSGALAAKIDQNSVVNDIVATGASSAQSESKNEVIAGGVVGILEDSELSRVTTDNSTTAYLEAGFDPSATDSDFTCRNVFAGGVIGHSINSEVKDVRFNGAVKTYNTDAKVATAELDYTSYADRSNALFAGGAIGIMEGGLASYLRGNATVEAGPADSSYAHKTAAGGVVGYANEGVTVEFSLFKGKVLSKAVFLFKDWYGEVKSSDRRVYAGGIVGEAFAKSSDKAQLANLEVDATIIGQCPHEQASGGIVGRGENVDVSNAVAKAQFLSYAGGNAKDNMIGGLVGDAKNMRLVNTYAKADVVVPEGTQENPVNPPFVGALVSKSAGGHMYDSYWSQKVAPVIIRTPEGTLVDVTCKEYSLAGEGPSARPVVANSTLLSLLRKNLGLDEGTVSVSIPSADYLPWIEKSESDGKWPKLDFDTNTLINVGL
jgi:hypothetical protein